MIIGSMILIEKGVIKMRCLITSLVLLLSVFLFCSINAPEYKVLSDSSKALILVQHFDDSHTIKNYDGSIQFGQLFAEYVAGALQELNYDAIAVKDASEYASAKYIIRGNLTTIDEGSWALRFWIGFGAGKASLAMSSILLELENEQKIDNFSNSRSSSTWQGADNILRRISAELARDIANSFSRSLSSIR